MEINPSFTFLDSQKKKNTTQHKSSLRMPCWLGDGFQRPQTKNFLCEVNFFFFIENLFAMSLVLTANGEIGCNKRQLYKYSGSMKRATKTDKNIEYKAIQK